MTFRDAERDEAERQCSVRMRASTVRNLPRRPTIESFPERVDASELRVHVDEEADRVVLEFYRGAVGNRSCQIRDQLADHVGRCEFWSSALAMPTVRYSPAQA